MAEIRTATDLTSNINATLVVGRLVNAIDSLRAGGVMSGESTPVSNNINLARATNIMSIRPGRH